MAENTNETKALWGWLDKRRLIRDGRLLAKEARYLLRKRARQLKPGAAEQINEALAELRNAGRSTQDFDALKLSIERLDRSLDKHLGAARKSTFREYVESIGIAVIIALVLRAFVIEAFKIPSGSMIPTLQVGDHIFVNKFTYGLRIPWTHVKFFKRQPHRGDVMVFIYPEDKSKDFIKRVIALGGDTVEVRDTVIYINGKAVKRTPVKEECRYSDRDEETQQWFERPCRAFIEELDGTPYRIVQDIDDTFRPNDFGPYRVPEGEVFVMGDNRFHSADSRVWQTTSTVPESYIKGRALIIWWSSKHWFSGIRWPRFFDLVHASTIEDA